MFFPFKSKGRELPEPDFAFPRTVIEQADSLLYAAEALPPQQAAVSRLRAVLQRCRAITDIDPDSIYELPRFIAAQADEMTNYPAGRAMALLLQARILNNIYEENSYRFERVSTPPEPLPEDIRLWSGEQFRSQKESLVNEAIALVRSNDVQLAVFNSCLEIDPTVELYLGTVYNFICLKSMTLSVIVDPLEHLLELAPGMPQTYLWYNLYGDGSSALSGFYEEHKDDEMAQILLLNMINMRQQTVEIEEIEVEDDDEADDDEDVNQSWLARANRVIGLERAVSQSLERFPASPVNTYLRSAAEELREPVVSCSFPSLSVPGTPISLTGRYLFCDSLRAEIYSVPDSDSDEYHISLRNLSLRRLIDSISIPTQSGLSGTFNITLPALEAGVYACVLKAGGENVSAPSLFTVTPILAAGIRGYESAGVVTVNPLTGKPVSSITVMKRDGENPAGLPGRTDNKGILTFPMSSSQLELRFAKASGALPRTIDINVRATMRRNETRKVQACIITDRQLYHPGDTVCWSVVAAAEEDGVQRMAAGLNLSMKFYNANHELIDTASVVTDEMGQAHGEFTAPRTGLTGRFAIQCSGAGVHAYQDVTVSDFRLPVFEVIDCAVERDTPTPGSVTVIGKARSFSGMNIIGAGVKVTVKEAQRSWRFIPGRLLGQVEGITDTDGAFRVVIPDSILTADTKCYTADVTVTTAAGETADDNLSFTTGRPYTLELKGETVLDAAAALPLKVMAYNPQGENVPLEIKWSILNKKGGEVLSGTGTTGIPLNIDASTLRAGRFYFSAGAVDSTQADELRRINLTIYNSSKNLVPEVDGPLFIPETSLTADSRGRAELLLGVSVDEAWVYIAYPGDLTVKMPELKRLSRGFHKIRVKDITESATLAVFTVKNGEIHSESVYIEVEEPVRPTLKASAFRDKLLPGTPERWSFTLAKADGTPVIPAAMVARMYNRALDVIQPSGFPYGLRFGQSIQYMDISWPWRLSGVSYLNLNGMNYSVPTLRQPEFRYLLMYSGRMMMNYSAVMMKSSANVTEADMAYDDTEEEVAPDGVLSQDVGAAAGAMDSRPETPQLKFRPSEVLQAFFRPDVKTDAEGNMVIEFTVPDANGSWKMQALAWDAQVQFACFVADITTAKPVMVQPNMPRFLRQGDKARLMASSFNNSDGEAEITTRVEIYEIDTERVLSASEFTNSVSAGESVVNGIEIDVPAEAVALGYRVYALTGDFSDGEQGVIPVLEAAQTVIDSHEFYLNPSDTEPVTLNIPAQEGMTYTLEFCNNPIWLAVKALRGVSAEVPSTSTGLSSQLFSLLAGKYLAQQNPALGEVVRVWNESPESQALKSMLERNQELKQVLLGSTPWVEAAKDNDLRMASLSQLFDAEANDAAVEKRITLLSSLQNPDGGLRWAECWEHSSVWSTESFLVTMALAKSLGISLSADLEPIIEQAYCYLCSKLEERQPSATDEIFTLISALMPEQERTELATHVISNTVAEIEGSWRQHSVTSKAYDILILKALGHDSTADNIFRSIEQFAVTRPDMGISFPSVDDIRAYATIMQAYKAMNAPQTRLDAMRQWVVLRSQVSDDFGAYNPDYVIASLLLSGTDWTARTPEAEITVNGQRLSTSGTEYATGYFTAALTPAADGMVVKVSPNGLTPSFGAVIGTGKRAMSAIEARPGRDISIDKRILVMRSGQWVETDSLVQGERARIQLTLRAERDLQYVTITDSRAATFAPVEQLPVFIFRDGLFFYRENRDAVTNVFINELPHGVYRIEYDMTAAISGSFSAGTATVQSQYAPEITARSGSSIINVSY